MSGPTFTDCNFISNKAYVAFLDDPLIYNPTLAVIKRGYPIYEYNGEDIMGYTVGGAIYFGNGCNGTIGTCDFINNAGDALYFGQNCNNCSINNDAAVSRGQPGSKNLFKGNIAPDDMFDGLSDYGGYGSLYPCRPAAAAAQFI